VSRKQLVGIVGKKGSGKNALASALGKLLEGEFLEVAFAGALKWAVQDIFRLSDEQVHGDLKEELDLRWGKTPRELMQLFGTEVGRQIDKEVWVKSVWAQAVQAWEAEADMVVVVTDVRFLNEAEFILKHGGLLVRVERPDPQVRMFGAHSSEMEMEKIVPHLTVVNDGPLKSLDYAAEWVEEGLSRPLSEKNEESTFVCSAAESWGED
jgi:ABC-type dipeptide/oligopeptide/nickel transport system ATPase component